MDQNTVLVTGANSGIGLAISKLFLQKGYFVFAHYRNDEKDLFKLGKKNLFPVRGDLSDPKVVKDIFIQCLNKKDRLDILINNAGALSASNNIEDIEEEDFDYIMRVNLKAPFLLSQFAIKHMKKHNSGRIINVSSIGVKYGGNPNSATYTISKAAVEAMTLSFSKAGAPYNILVNTVRAGVTNTNIHQKVPQKNIDERIAMIPLKRWAEPEEIASTIFFLASEDCSFTTGTILTVAGGE
jgi:2-dehydro-3-deoxy-L-rhamnonate dehydrogenase (NAD+)